ncbi:hypothetical protein EDB84DRAFT_1435377 [Lactarius hengduanensis]|nr:hypothetical protein EDB84DRAFT_1435377 [Lactarius hengduanensis]
MAKVAPPAANSPRIVDGVERVIRTLFPKASKFLSKRVGPRGSCTVGTRSSTRGLRIAALGAGREEERRANGLVLYLGQELTAFQLFVKGRDLESQLLEMGKKVVEKMQDAAIGTWKLGISTGKGTWFAEKLNFKVAGEYNRSCFPPDINSNFQEPNLAPAQRGVGKDFLPAPAFLGNVSESRLSTQAATRSPLLTSPAQLNWRTRPRAALAEHGLQLLFWVVVMDGRLWGHTGSFSAPAFATVAVGAVSGHRFLFKFPRPAFLWSRKHERSKKCLLVARFTRKSEPAQHLDSDATSLTQEAGRYDQETQSVLTTLVGDEADKGAKRKRNRCKSKRNDPFSSAHVGDAESWTTNGTDQYLYDNP